MLFSSLNFDNGNEIDNFIVSRIHVLKYYQNLNVLRKSLQIKENWRKLITYQLREFGTKGGVTLSIRLKLDAKLTGMQLWMVTLKQQGISAAYLSWSIIEINVGSMKEAKIKPEISASMSLPRSPQGKPLKIVKYDNFVQAYIKKLLLSSGIINSRIIISAAEGILLASDNTLLLNLQRPNQTKSIMGKISHESQWSVKKKRNERL